MQCGCVKNAYLYVIAATPIDLLSFYGKVTLYVSEELHQNITKIEKDLHEIRWCPFKKKIIVPIQF